MTWPEEKLLYEAEQAATRCGLCREFGHWTKECPTLRFEVDQCGRQYTVRRYKLSASLFWGLCWAAWGFMAGWVGAQIWRAGQ